jgi:hypothetical protein
VQILEYKMIKNRLIAGNHYAGRYLVIACLFLSLFQTLTGATITSRQSGNWNATATWTGGIVPAASDDVIIGSGHTITVNVPAACSSLSFQAVKKHSKVAISGTNGLTVTGAVSMPKPLKNRTCTIETGDGYFSCGSVNMLGTTAFFKNIITVGTGTFSVAGNVTSGTTGCQFTFIGAGTMNFAGNFTGSPVLTVVSGSTVDYNGTIPQTILPVTYSILKLSGSEAKTITGITVNDILSVEGAATTAGTAPVYGLSAALIYNRSVSLPAGAEWITPFTPAGGVTIAGNGAVILNSAKIFPLAVTLTVNSGSTLITNDQALTFGGNFINNGTVVAGSSPVTISGNMTSQNIGGLTTTGAVSVTKTGGSVLLTGTIGASSMSFAGSDNTSVSLSPGISLNLTGPLSLPLPASLPVSLDVGAGSLTCGSISLGGNNSSAAQATTISVSTGTVTVSGDITAAGTYSRFIFTDSGILRIGGSFMSPVTGTFTASTGTVVFNASGNQTVGSYTYNNLTLSGSGLKTMSDSTPVNGLLFISGSAVASLTDGAVISVYSLWLNGVFQLPGSWGSTASPATFTNDIFFDSNRTGILNVLTGEMVTPIFSELTPSQSVPNGTPSVTLSGTLRAPGPVYPADGETVSVTINGLTLPATISGGSGIFSLDFPTAAIPYSLTPYVITYSYPEMSTCFPPRTTAILPLPSWHWE